VWLKSQQLSRGHCKNETTIYKLHSYHGGTRSPEIRVKCFNVHRFKMFPPDKLDKRLFFIPREGIKLRDYRPICVVVKLLQLERRPNVNLDSRRTFEFLGHTGMHVGFQGLFHGPRCSASVDHSYITANNKSLVRSYEFYVVEITELWLPG